MSRRAWRVVLAALLTCGVVGAAAWLVFFSPVLGVRHVAVSGNVMVTDEEVRRAAAVRELTPMATVDLEAVRRAVAGLRRVESATVERAWPDTLKVRVAERRPVAVVPWGGAAAVVDRHAVVIETKGSAPFGLPALQVPRFAAGDPATMAALKVAGGLPEDLTRMIRTVSATSAADVSLRLGDGRTIMWGGAERTRDKARIALTLLERPAQRYDVSSPDVVTIK
ncbi:hypothetical protein Skr01_71560 [Sphaerisporangium krabiense]|uniref:Cell division protein FtsQ n=1 Tax=Sphaerisporangium krabiense TaxID=763782 RepID=A0A7W8Z8E5_9ACTN|nr:FtsQ-type POTRA domain-containing protein [Sphaerisporangium krabiense]MBB5629297.1 cell division protein FtsQ [Sphaerisporangium krabiense]GII67071.1 hypothetical protein Skr01_71560 [Sphaerisporangium krabiense]